MIDAYWPMRFVVGIASSVSRAMVVCCRTFWISTTDASPETVIVSATVPTFISALTCAVNPVVSSMPSRLNVAKPGSVKLTSYVPGRRSTIRYRPWLSVVTDRTFSISAGLLASTVTPGITAPEVSRAIPAIVPLVVWAWLGSAHTERIDSIRNDAIRQGFIAFSFALTGRSPARKRFTEEGTDCYGRSTYAGEVVFCPLSQQLARKFGRDRKSTRLN